MYNKHIEIEYDPEKEQANIAKHGIDFRMAREVFLDPEYLLLRDDKHSSLEERYYAIGKATDGRIITTWFTRREERIRIIGAAELRRWKKFYISKNRG